MCVACQQNQTNEVCSSHAELLTKQLLGTQGVPTTLLSPELEVEKTLNPCVGLSGPHPFLPTTTSPSPFPDYRGILKLKKNAGSYLCRASQLHKYHNL
eukprot:1145018-Pelagomonas_calceolata.AAC.2